MVRGRYRRVLRKDKIKILDESTQVVGYHRKSAIRLLNAKGRSEPRRRPGQSKKYRADVVGVLRLAWEATDRLCSKRLQPFLPELIPVLRRYDDSFISSEVAAQLCRMSPSTIDRVLRPWRRLGGRRPLFCTKPGSLLKNSIPVRTFADWDENRSGFLEVDLVHHCGESAEGFYLTTLSTVDVGRLRRLGMHGSMGKGTGSGWRCCSQSTATSPLSPSGGGFGQRWGVHQQPSLYLLPKGRHCLHQVSLLQEER